jgi:hypothetical protein
MVFMWQSPLAPRRSKIGQFVIVSRRQPSFVISRHQLSSFAIISRRRHSSSVTISRRHSSSVVSTIVISRHHSSFAISHRHHQPSSFVISRRRSSPPFSVVVILRSPSVVVIRHHQSSSAVVIRHLQPSSAVVSRRHFSFAIISRHQQLAPFVVSSSCRKCRHHSPSVVISSAGTEICFLIFSKIFPSQESIVMVFIAIFHPNRKFDRFSVHLRFVLRDDFQNKCEFVSFF